MNGRQNIIIHIKGTSPKSDTACLATPPPPFWDFGPLREGLQPGVLNLWIWMWPMIWVWARYGLGFRNLGFRVWGLGFRI